MKLLNSILAFSLFVSSIAFTHSLNAQTDLVNQCCEWGFLQLSTVVSLTASGELGKSYFLFNYISLLRMID